MYIYQPHYFISLQMEKSALKKLYLHKDIVLKITVITLLNLLSVVVMVVVIERMKFMNLLKLVLLLHLQQIL
jgi:hypothetical protein